MTKFEVFFLTCSAADLDVYLNSLRCLPMFTKNVIGNFSQYCFELPSAFRTLTICSDDCNFSIFIVAVSLSSPDFYFNRIFELLKATKISILKMFDHFGTYKTSIPAYLMISVLIQAL